MSPLLVAFSTPSIVSWPLPPAHAAPQIGARRISGRFDKLILIHG
jgi:hypothetical protein